MSESVQKKLLKVKPPRIQITYDIETNGAMITKELPAIFGIIGDFSGMRDENKPLIDYKLRKFINLDGGNFTDVFKSFNPRILLSILDMDGKTTNTFEYLLDSISDFKPINIIKKIDTLFKLYQQKKKITELRTKYDLNKKSGTVLDNLLSDNGLQETFKKQIAAFLGITQAASAGTASPTDKKATDGAKPAADEKTTADTAKTATPAPTTAPATAGTLGKELGDFLLILQTTTDEQKKYTADLVGSYITAIQENQNIGEKKFLDFFNKFVLLVTTKLGYFVNQILHNKDFQELEAHWRGVQYVMNNIALGDSTRIRIFNASEEELLQDLTESMEFDQSHLFKEIYENEYGTLGGTPYTAMMWDHALNRSGVNFSLLSKMTEVMAASHCPMFLGVDPSFLGMTSFQDLPEPHSIATLFESEELSSFNGFRQEDDAKYVTFVLPRMLARCPYNTKEMPMEHLDFTEVVDGTNGSDYVWTNAAYAYFTNVINSYSISGWFNSICGTENGGKVDNLPIYGYKSVHGDYKVLCPTEVAITDRREKELSDRGFVALCHAKNTNYAVFFSNNSSFESPVFSENGATENAILSKKTPYILNISRFAHYLKCMIRDKVGTFTNKEMIQSYISNWLSQYTLLDDKASRELKSKYPLREFVLAVDEIPGKPGFYNATLKLRPHNELDGMEISLRLVNHTK